MRKKITLAALVVTGLASLGLARAVARRPSSSRVEGTISVEASPAAVASQLSDLQRWIAWAPRERLDPAAHRIFGGPRAGVGASYYWSGNEAVGKGRLTVISSSDAKVELEAELERPRHDAYDIEAGLAPDGGSTRVTWTELRELDFKAKVLRLFTHPDGAVSASIEEGLTRLKAAAETQARVDADEKARAFRVERSATMAAPPGAVYAQLADLRRWAAWSPWERSDQQVRRTYGGPAAGVGQSYYWTGDDDAGRGRLTITRSSAETVELEQDVGQPQPYLSDMVLRVVADGPVTRVSWVLTGLRERNADVTQTEAALGARLEDGLSRLKAVVEATAGAQPSQELKPRG